MNDDQMIRMAAFEHARALCLQVGNSDLGDILARAKEIEHYISSGECVLFVRSDA